MNGWAKKANSREVRSELIGGNQTRYVAGGGSGGGGVGGKGAVVQSRRGRAFAAVVARLLMMLRAESAKNYTFRPAAAEEARTAEHLLPHPANRPGVHVLGPACSSPQAARCRSFRVRLSSRR